jgi:hypothetical protein
VTAGFIKSKKVAIGVLVLAFTLLVLLVALTTLQRVCHRRAIAADITKCQRIVQDIERGVLIADADGIVRLPFVLQEGCAAYVTHRSDGNLLVLFPYWLGKGSDLRGYLYVSKGLSSIENAGNADVEKGCVEAIGPDTPYPGVSGRSCPLNLHIDETLDVRWCHVTYLEH